ncbi:MAG: hypothetical protein ACR2FG_02310 [Marmoricola sp.]
MTTISVHVRSLPDKTSPSLGVLPTNTTVAGLDVGGWVLIQYGNDDGYVSMLSTVDPADTPDSSQPPALPPPDCFAPEMLSSDSLYVQSTVQLTLRVVGDRTGETTATVAGGPDDETAFGRYIGTGDTLVLHAFSASYWVRYLGPLPDLVVPNGVTLEIVEWHCISD